MNNTFWFCFFLVHSIRRHLAKHSGVQANPEEDRTQALLRFKHFSQRGKFKVGEGDFHYIATSITTTFSTSYLKEEERKCSQLCPKYQINNESAYTSLISKLTRRCPRCAPSGCCFNRLYSGYPQEVLYFSIQMINTCLSQQCKQEERKVLSTYVNCTGCWGGKRQLNMMTSQRCFREISSTFLSTSGQGQSYPSCRTTVTPGPDLVFLHILLHKSKCACSLYCALKKSKDFFKTLVDPKR